MVATTDSILSTLVGRQFTDAVEAARAHLDRFQVFAKLSTAGASLGDLERELHSSRRHLQEAADRLPRLRRLRDEGTCPDCRGTGSPVHPLPGYCVTCSGIGQLRCLRGQKWTPPGPKPPEGD